MSNQEQIDKLKKEGYRVYISHHRWYCNTYGVWSLLPLREIRKLKEQNLYWPDCIDCRGGATVVEVCKDKEILRGEASCSDVDNFNRKRGVKIALGRALYGVSSISS